MGKLNEAFTRCQCSLMVYLSPVVDLAIRLYIGNIFFISGWSKFEYYLNDNWSSTVYLFTEVYPVPGIPPEIAAVLGTGGELIFSVLLIIGLFSRLGAFVLLIMTAVIEFTFKSLPEHTYWALLLATIFARGGGTISLDHLVRKYITKTI